MTAFARYPNFLLAAHSKPVCGGDAVPAHTEGSGAQVVPTTGQLLLLPQPMQRDGTSARRFDAISAWQGTPCVARGKLLLAKGYPVTTGLCEVGVFLDTRRGRIDSSCGLLWLNFFSLHGLITQALMKLDLHGHSWSFIWNMLMTQGRQVWLQCLNSKVHLSLQAGKALISISRWSRIQV